MPDSTIPHLCHALGCTVPVEPAELMCVDHWDTVPPPLKAAVIAAYRPGQEIDKQPTMVYMLAAFRAIYSVAISEGRISRDEAERRLELIRLRGPALLPVLTAFA